MSTLSSHEAKLLLQFMKKVKGAWSPIKPVPDVYRSESYGWWINLPEPNDHVVIPLEISCMLEQAYRQGQERVKNKVTDALNKD